MRWRSEEEKIVEIENGKVGHKSFLHLNKCCDCGRNILHVFLPHDAISICETKMRKHAQLRKSKTAADISFRFNVFFPLINLSINSSPKIVFSFAVFYFYTFRGYVSESMLREFMYEQLTA